MNVLGFNLDLPSTQLQTTLQRAESHGLMKPIASHHLQKAGMEF